MTVKDEHLAKQAEGVKKSAVQLERSATAVEQSADRNTVLAADRTVLATERTYAAWVRTGLAALASGAGAKALLGPDSFKFVGNSRASWNHSSHRCSRSYAKPELCRRVTDRVSVLFRTDLADKPPLKFGVCGG